MKKILIFSAFAAFIVSCNEDTSIPIPNAAVSYTNTIPGDTSNLDVINNTTRIDTGLVFGDNSPYYNADPGTYNITFAKRNTGDPVASVTTEFFANTFYSVFAIRNGSINSAVVVKDQIVVPSLDSSFVRFFHFSPDAGGVDVAVTGGATLFASRFFNDQDANPSKAEFMRLLAGTYNLEVRPIGSGTAVLTLPSTLLEGGKVYTVYARGLVAEAAPYNLGAGIIVNYPND